MRASASAIPLAFSMSCCCFFASALSSVAARRAASSSASCFLFFSHSSFCQASRSGPMSQGFFFGRSAVEAEVLPFGGRVGRPVDGLTGAGEGTAGRGVTGTVDLARFFALHRFRLSLPKLAPNNKANNQESDDPGPVLVTHRSPFRHTLQFCSSYSCGFSGFHRTEAQQGS